MENVYQYISHRLNMLCCPTIIGKVGSLQSALSWDQRDLNESWRLMFVKILSTNIKQCQWVSVTSDLLQLIHYTMLDSHWSDRDQVGGQGRVIGPARHLIHCGVRLVGWSITYCHRKRKWTGVITSPFYPLINSHLTSTHWSNLSSRCSPTENHNSDLSMLAIVSIMLYQFAKYAL